MFGKRFLYRKLRVCTLLVCPILIVCNVNTIEHSEGGPAVTVSATSHGPVAEFEELNLNLGDVEITSSDTRVNAAIRVKNVGDAALRIHQLEVSCGCTRVVPPDGPINPGESVEIAVGVTISRAGKSGASVTVHSNSIESPKVIVRLHWDAIAPIVVVPEGILLVEVGKGQIKTGRTDLVLSRFQTCPLSNVSLGSIAQSDSLVSIKLDDTGTLHVKSVHPTIQASMLTTWS